MFQLLHFRWSTFVSGTYFVRFYTWVRLIDWHIYSLHPLILSTKSAGKLPCIGFLEILVND
jgi:hypothetical protein